ncbi:MAG TPA: hypothetical protein ENF42_03640 [Candidatus Bathyarchaeota archaeon]|nr:hypothetical protein [Candidatus Bathyarchaeota archaeon]
MQRSLYYTSKFSCSTPGSSAGLQWSAYAVDSTCIGFDSFSMRGRRLLRFCVLYWPLACIACVFTSARRLAEFIRLVPWHAVLAGDGEFWRVACLPVCAGA